VAVTTDERICPSCGEPVQPGRLACPSCGELLAAVEGAADRFPGARPMPSAPSVAPAPPGAAPPTAEPEPAPSPEPAPGPEPARSAEPEPAPSPEPAPGPEPARIAEPEPAPSPEPARIAGAYIPPSSRPWETAPAEAMPGHVPASAGVESAPTGREADIPAAGAGDALRANTPPGPIVAGPSPGTQRASFAVPADPAGRIVAIAAPLAALSFLLPFAQPGSIVVGGGVGGDYLSDWGLAAPGNLVPFGLAILLLVLAVVPSRLADWFRFGVLPLVAGGAMAAIGWVQVTWPGGYGLGVIVLIIASFLLLGAGTLAIRNAVADRSVP
jgi:hypothetical protein